MELLPEFEVIRATTVEEAVGAGSQSGANYIGGGTDLMPNLRRGVHNPIAVVDLSAISEMNQIEETNDGLRIGAGVTLQQLITDPRIQREYKVVAEAAETIAGTTHRQSATVGGNLCLDTRCQYYNQSEWWRKANNYCLKHKGDVCHVAPNGNICRAAFTGDLAPVMLLHGAQVEVASVNGSRTIDLDKLYQEDGADHLLLEAGELLVAVTLKKLDGYKTAYRKVRIRGGIDYALAGVAMATKGSENQLKDIRVALTGTNSRPILLEGTDELSGKAVDSAALKALEKLVRSQSKPMRSTVTPGPYRSKVVVNVTRRLAKDLLDLVEG